MATVVLLLVLDQVEVGAAAHSAIPEVPGRLVKAIMVGTVVRLAMVRPAAGAVLAQSGLMPALICVALAATG